MLMLQAEGQRGGLATLARSASAVFRYAQRCGKMKDLLINLWQDNTL
jgi:hypothetical protein